MRLLIGADVVATENNLSYFQSGQMRVVIGNELEDIWQSADARIFNIEAPIINEEHPIQKAGVCLRMREDVIPGIKALSPSLVTLANNHILDHGQEGIINSIKVLEDAKIPYVGVGRNQEDAATVKYIEKDEMKIGVYACAEHEFSIISEGKWGANPYDPLETFDHIYEGKQHCDYLIVLYHGGREFYRYPSPEVQRCFRKMADKGADIVIAQHTHCVGCYEEYKGSTLVYGQGNFIFDRVDDEYWNSGILVDIRIKKNEKKIGFIPYVKEKGVIRLAEEKENEEIMKGFWKRSEDVKDNRTVKDRYDEYISKNFEKAFRVLHGNTLLFMIINKLMGGGLVYRMYKKLAELAVLNYIECEAHRELLICGLKKHLGDYYER